MLDRTSPHRLPRPRTAPVLPIAEEEHEARETLRCAGRKIRSIVAAVSEHFDCAPWRVMVRSRRYPNLRYRMIAMAIARDRFETSFSEIARRFGGYDHTTVRSNRSAALARYAADIAAVNAILDRAA